MNLQSSEKIIYIVRHCEKPQDVSNENLSSKGEQHAELIGKYFNDQIELKPLTFMACMPANLLTKNKIHGTANRAYQTAKIIAKECHISDPIITHPEWIPIQEKLVASSILDQIISFPILIAWEHDHIASLCQYLGFKQVQTWSSQDPMSTKLKPDSTEFSTCYRLDLTNKKFTFFQLPK